MKIILRYTFIISAVFAALACSAQDQKKSNPIELWNKLKKIQNQDTTHTIKYWKLMKFKNNFVSNSSLVFNKTFRDYSITDTTLLKGDPKKLRKQVNALYTKIKNRIGTRLYRNGLINKDSLSVMFVGNGNIQKTFDDGSELPANTGIGAIYHRFYTQSSWWPTLNEVEADLMINIASTADTINIVNNASEGLVEFGNYLLLPSNSGQSTSLYFKLYFGNTFMDGIQTRLDGSNRNLSIISDSLEVKNSKISAISWRIGPYHEFIPDEKRIKNNYSIIFGLDYSLRSIQGDFGQKIESDLRERLLGDDNNNWHGIQPYLSIKLKNIIAEVSYAYFWKRSEVDVPGLTGGHLQTTIRFTGGFPLRID